MQVLALVAMEKPISMQADDIRDEKVKVVRCLRTIRPEDCVLGQYQKGGQARLCAGVALPLTPSTLGMLPARYPARGLHAGPGPEGRPGAPVCGGRSASDS